MEIKDQEQFMQKMSELLDAHKDATSADVQSKVDTAIADLKDEQKAMKVAMARTNIVDEMENSDTDVASYEKAFDSYLRSGEKSSFSGLEGKAAIMHTDTPAEGGYAVPLKLEEGIIKLVTELNPIRSYVNVKSVGAAPYTKNIQTTRTSATWRGQLQPVVGNDSPEFGQFTINTHELSNETTLTYEQMEDSNLDIMAFVAEESAREFAIAEQTAFMNGGGDVVMQPSGLLTFVGGAAQAIRQIQEVPVAAALDGDSLIDLVYTIQPMYRQGATWVMNRKSLSEVRKLKDADGNSLINVALDLAGAGIQETLLGYRILEDESLPDYVSGETPILFGNLKGFTVLDRIGTSSLVNPYKAHGFVSVFTRKRVGAGLEDGQGIVAAKVA